MMRIYCFLLSLSMSLAFAGRCTAQPAKITMEELDKKYRTEWSKPEYQAANTAAKAKYLSEEEKKVFYYLNLARLNPLLFAGTYAKDYEGTQKYPNHVDFSDNKRSLIDALRKLAPMPLLYPDAELYEYAKCQAAEMGKRGLMTHDRTVTGCRSLDIAENLSIGKHDPLEIVMLFLIDAGSQTMGHRRTCLDSNRHRMGVAIAEHKTKKECVVMDLGF